MKTRTVASEQFRMEVPRPTRKERAARVGKSALAGAAGALVTRISGGDPNVALGAAFVAGGAYDAFAPKLRRQKKPGVKASDFNFSGHMVANLDHELQGRGQPGVAPGELGTPVANSTDAVPPPPTDAGPAA
jgi:precorrin-3B methylase